MKQGKNRYCKKNESVRKISPVAARICVVGLTAADAGQLTGLSTRRTDDIQEKSPAKTN